MVEFALVLPLLVFLLIGVFEVGWAIRGYLVLTNANREAARFAVRQTYLDFDAPTLEQIGYEKVWSHTLISVGDQIPMSNTVMIISYITISASCTGTYTATTPIDMPTYTWRFPVTATEVTQIDYQELANHWGPYEKRHVCDVEAWSGIEPLPLEMVIVEQWYYQPQLFGFPLISNPLLDPVPMYTHTNFRKAPESRPDGFQTPIPTP